MISKDTQHQINQTVDVRKQFVHYYDELNTTTLIPIFDEAVPFYQSYIDEVIQFLKNENVPITAFGKRRISHNENYKAYLIDLDGTMYKGNEEIDGAAQFISYLNNQNIPHLYVTNNSTKEPEEVASKLNTMGIVAQADEVVTSAQPQNFIAEESPGATVYMLGGSGLSNALTAQGLVLKDDEFVDYVVVGLDEQVTYEKLSTATLGVRNGAKFISTNQDVSIPKERGFYQVMERLQVSCQLTGVQPVFIGKPEPIIMNKA